MPILDNLKHERFAQLVAAGEIPAEAYQSAGFKAARSTAHVAASRMRRRPLIAARIEEIMDSRRMIEELAIERAIERTAITKERVMIELAKVGFANMADYIKPTADGAMRLSLEGVTRDQMAAVSQITVEVAYAGAGKTRRPVPYIRGFRLYNKVNALVDLGREIGMFVNRGELKVEHDYGSLTPDQRMKWAEKLLEDARRALEAPIIENEPEEGEGEG